MQDTLVPDGALSRYDLEAAKILDDFLPPRLFDAHFHVLHDQSAWGGPADVRTAEEYFGYMKAMVGSRPLQLNVIPFPFATMKDRKNGHIDFANAFAEAQVQTAPDSVAEVLVHPEDTAEDMEARLFSPRVRGLKCYHTMVNRPDTFDSDIEEYLPEAAWEVARKHKLVITLHMVKDKALADPANLSYIRNMAKAFPDVVLILAHAARSFAAWTGLETVRELAPYENIWFDFAAVCESPAMAQILKVTGTGRSMWGSDFPVSVMRGKAISLADGFYWLYDRELRAMNAPGLHTWAIGTENLMAVRQACILADCGSTAVEALFYGNAARLFGV